MPIYKKGEHQQNNRPKSIVVGTETYCNPTDEQLIAAGWEILPDPVPVPYTPNPADLKPALLQSAVEYEKKYIQASGVGILTLGVLAGLPKSLAFKNWLNALWLEHDHREALIDNGDLAPDYDFSTMGSPGITVNELKQEVGV